MSTITQFPSGNTQYRIEFDYLARTFVVVTLVNSSNPTLNRVLEVGRDYRFLNPTMIEMLVDQSGFDIVRIHRQTGTDLVVDFRNGSVLTASDLTNAELQAIHIAEEGRDQTVDLAKEYADAAGNSAGNAKDSEDEARRIAASIKAAGLFGYITRRSFEKGFNVTIWNEALLWEEDGDYYRWDGTLPKNVPAGSTPETSGGIGSGAWVSVGDASLRSDISGTAGYDLVGGATYSQIRSYTGLGKSIKCIGRSSPLDMASGIFVLDAADTTSADDDGTVLVDTLGRRWKRVIDGDVYPEWWGAVGDNVTPCAAAFQAALDYCSGKNRSSTGTGYRLRIRGGRYIIETGLTYTWRYDSGVIDDGDMRRLSIQGDGTGNTYLIYTGSSSTPALSIKGGTGDGIYLRMHLDGFRLWRSLGLTRYLGSGIAISRGAKFDLSNVDLGIFNTALYLEDTLYGTIQNCDLSGNNQGVQATISAVSQPNSISFYRCNFGGCKVRGAYIINGSNVEFDSCTFEGIGSDGTNESLLYQGGPQEGGQGLRVNNCYFENNYTLYDINISNTLAHAGTHQLLGNSFNRTSDTRYTVGGSVNLYSKSAQMRVTMQANAFKGFNTYVADSSRPAYIVQTSAVTVTEINNYFMYTVELPNRNNFPVTGQGVGNLGAAATVTAAGGVSVDFNVASVSNTSTGVWVVTLRKALRSTPVVCVSIYNGVGFATATVAGTASITINTYNHSGSATNLGFSLAVFGVIA